MLDKQILSEVITRSDILSQRCIVRDGFVFAAVTEPWNVYDALVIRNPFDALCFSPRYLNSERSLEEHIRLVNDLCLEKAVVIGTDISFLPQCPSLHYLNILPLEAAGDGFDFSPLYVMPEIRELFCAAEYGEYINPASSDYRKMYVGYVDYTKIQGLQSTHISGRGHLNYNKVTTLRYLGAGGHRGVQRDLTDLIGSPVLEELTLIQCGIKSLNGIEVSKCLKKVDLSYNRALEDISQLISARDTLQRITIQNCPKIGDFSILGELENLEHLELLGSNKLPDISFLRKMKSLKYFKFDIDVSDGDLTPCLSIPYVKCLRNRKHFNLKNEQLPPFAR